MAHIDNCTASSESNSNWDCHKVYSGPEDREWEIDSDDNVTPWIKVILRHNYYLHQLMIKQSSKLDSRFTQIDIEFSGGKSIRNQDLRATDDWITIAPLNGIFSRYVNITRKKSRGPTNIGRIAEIRAFGCLQGTLSEN